MQLDRFTTKAQEALQAAQLEIAAQARWKAPYYWAGFVLSGEWK